MAIDDVVCSDNTKDFITSARDESGQVHSVSYCWKFDCGANLVIDETLVLSVDQQSKFKSAINASGPVFAYQLDSIKKLDKKLSNTKNGTNVSVFYAYRLDV